MDVRIEGRKNMDLITCPICSGEMIQKEYGSECQNCGEIFCYDDKSGFTTIDMEEYKQLLDENKIEFG